MNNTDKILTWIIRPASDDINMNNTNRNTVTDKIFTFFKRFFFNYKISLYIKVFKIVFLRNVYDKMKKMSMNVYFEIFICLTLICHV